MRRTALTLLLLITFGCIKKTEPGPAPLGPEIPSATIDGEVAKALRGTSALAIQKGQMAHYELAWHTEGRAPQKVMDKILEVVDRTETDTEIILTLNETENTAKDGKLDTVVRESKQVLKKQAGPENLVQNLFAKKTTKKRTYHALTSRPVHIPAPEAVAAKPDCLGLPHCELNGVEISYEEAVWSTDTDYDKIIWHMVISPDSPYLARRVSACIQKLMPSETTQVLVTQCMELVDFEFTKR